MGRRRVYGRGLWCGGCGDCGCGRGDCGGFGGDLGVLLWVVIEEGGGYGVGLGRGGEWFGYLMEREYVVVGYYLYVWVDVLVIV